MIYVFSLITIPVIIFLAIEDLLERMIYSFPVLLLSATWAVYTGFIYKDNLPFLITAWVLAIALYAVFKIGHIWGDGDSDMWLLFVGIILSTFKMESVFEFLFTVCILLIMALAEALLTGLIEALIKKRKLNKNLDIAVVPGFTSVIIGILVYGIL